MTTPLVTIGITCFNAADTIERAIKSASLQDWPNIEVLIIDDASTDKSINVINNQIENIHNARLIQHSENTGPAGARNTILNEATGEFIAFFDDDDRSLPTRISEQMRHITKYEQQSSAKLVACYASGIRKYSNGYTLSLEAIGSKGKNTPQGRGIAEYLLLYIRRPDWFYGSGTPTCSLLIRKSTLEAVGGFDNTLRRVEDVDLAIRLALAGAHFIGTKKQLFVQHSTHSNDKSPEKNLEAEQALANKYKQFLDSIGRYYYAKHWPQLRYWHFKRNYLRFFTELIGLFYRYPLALPKHLLTTGPKRLIHEFRMKQEKPL